MILAFSVTVALTLFGILQWSLALKGETTIEKKGKERGDGKNYDFSKSSRSKNLEVIFGT
jgi:hypothetical protein